jgi:hypothetical protein
MTNLLDGMGIGLLEVGPDKCPICDKAPHPDRTTKDKKEKKGCLKSIPANLGCAPLPPMPTLPNYATAAHHLIPANQCLKPFKRLSQMCETVGYDVNNGANGLSLPTCGQQALNRYRQQGGGDAKYGDLDSEDKANAAFAIMSGLNLQWHVGHHDWAMDFETDNVAHVENYDKLVKKKLEQLEKDIRQQGGTICDPEDNSESGSAVIGELNALSQEIKGHVQGWNAYFVSAMSCRFASKYR